MRFVGSIYKDVIVSKGINHTDYIDENEIELTEEQYDSIHIPCKLVNGEFVSCDFPKTECVPVEDEPTAQDDIDAMLIDHEYRLTLIELGVIE